VAAVETGYKEASRAIFDANITNVIAAVLMASFGSGPVKGFAVVLMIGIVTSVFTSMWLTRMWVAQWLRRARPTDLICEGSETMKLLKLVPDNTNIHFLKWRVPFYLISLLLMAPRWAWCSPRASTWASISSAAR
jgi:preprotein translocase subunit SecF